MELIYWADSPHVLETPQLMFDPGRVCGGHQVFDGEPAFVGAGQRGVLPQRAQVHGTERALADLAVHLEDLVQFRQFL